MAINRDKPDLWKQDIIQSVDLYNSWFMEFAPRAFRETRVSTACNVEAALKITNYLQNISIDVLRNHPEILPILRMSTCPPIARDRLIGLAQVSKSLVGMIAKENLAMERKWTHFPIRDTIVSEKSLPILGNYFNIKRGLATGDNKFFILTKKQIEELNLDMSFFSPILPSPRYLKVGEIFQDENGYTILDSPHFLLNCTLPESKIKNHYPQLWKYLESGRETTAKKYLCKSRKVWYMQEYRVASPFLCSYMGRASKDRGAPFRFILNHSKALATNSYLMLYPKVQLLDAISAKPEILNKIWEGLKSITTSDLESEGRVYGGGLKKIEPKELSNVKCQQLAQLIAMT